MKAVLLSTGLAVLSLAALAAPGVTQATIQELRSANENLRAEPALKQASPSTIQNLHSANTVTLSGEVVRLSDDDFVLDDGTGQIEVEAETAAIREGNLSVSTTVTVTGYYDENEFEALTLTPAGGETITIFDD